MKERVDEKQQLEEKAEDYTEEQPIKKRSQFKSIWFRFKKNKLAMLGLALLVITIIIALFAGFIVDYEEDAIFQNMHNRLKTPCKEHILGTDQYGRDIFARVIFGSRISISVGFITIVLALIGGTFFGAIAGYYGGKVDNIIMRIMDVFLAVPAILLAIAIVAALGSNMVNLFIAMAIPQIPRFARIIRSSIMGIKGEEFIEAAKACGTSDFKIILKHVIPNVMGPMIVQATLTMGTTILNIAALSFVGLGIEPPTPEWGSMLADGRLQMRHYPHLVIIPGLAILYTVLSLNLMGDGLRDALDPKLKN